MIRAHMGEEFDEENPMLSFCGFCRIMSSPVNDGFSFEKQKLYQDMTQPLSFYYMASSHNTYLEGDQLQSKSSINRYVDDLCRGCRCVKLDCWDGDDGQPVIFHGHTLTSKILFRDVINAMSEFNFRVSPYPVVLSIENHCSPTQQVNMAEIMNNALGDFLLKPFSFTSSGDFLPSLEELKHKVLIKGERLLQKSEAQDNNDGDNNNSDSDSGDIDDGDIDDGDSDDSTQDGIASANNSISSSLSSVKTDKPPKKKKTEVHPDLSKIVYLGTMKAKLVSFSKDASTALPPKVMTSNSILPDIMSSYTESKTVKICNNDKTSDCWFMHNKSHLSRIYPKGTRVDSSNYNPCPEWAAGNQLVALNYQTAGVYMHLNHSKFRENGGCGYVLKPPYMIGDGVDASPPVTLKIHLISGQHLPKSRGALEGKVINPYISFAIYGTSTKEPEYKHSSVLPGNGFNSVWDEIFEFDVPHPDVSQLYVKVMNFDYNMNQGVFIAYTSTPINCLLSGYRSFKLFDERGNRYGDFSFASLFLRITIVD